MATQQSSIFAAEPNVQLAFACGFVSKIILQMFAAHGVPIDPETAQDLPGMLVLVSAYVPDVIQKWRIRNNEPSKPVA